MTMTIIRNVLLSGIHLKIGNTEKGILFDDLYVIACKAKTAQFRYSGKRPRVDDFYMVSVEIEDTQVIESLERAFLQLLDLITYHSHHG